jgi:hypothetical protein
MTTANTKEIPVKAMARRLAPILARVQRTDGPALRLAALLAVVALAIIAFSAAPALAARGHVRSSLPAFGGVCAAAPCEGALKEPFGAAVEEATGDVYVLDNGSNRVVRYSSSGAYLGEFNGSGLLPGEGKAAGSGGMANEEPTGAFKGPQSIAIDNSCALADARRAREAKAPLTTGECEKLDPSNGDVYVVDSFGKGSRASTEPINVIDKFTATGEYVGQITRKSITNPKMIEFLNFSGVAVDPNGRVFASGIHVELVPRPGFNNGEEIEVEVAGVDAFSNATVNSWESWRQYEANNTNLVVFGLAVDSLGDVYARNEGGSGGLVSEWAFGTGFILEPISSPVGGQEEAVTGVTFGGVATEASTNDVYIDNASSIARLGPASGGSNPLVERFGAGDLPAEPCHREIGTNRSCSGGIAVDSATGQVYVVTSEEEVLQFILEEPAAPRVESESLAGLTDDSAALQAEVNPRSLGGEAGTEYHFEYGQCSGGPGTCGSTYGSSTPTESLPASFDVESVSASLEGLQADSTYHFRVVASNGHGSVLGADQVFTTRVAGEFALPDGRQWEMVSPSDLHGTLIQQLNHNSSEGSPVQAAVGGEAFTFATVTPTESEPAGNANNTQVFSARGPSGGWSSHDITVAHAAAATTSLGEGAEARVFSEDLSESVFQPFGPFTPLSASASEQTAYLHDNTSGAFTPFVTGCPESESCPAAIEAAADVPPGTVFGQSNSETEPGKSPCPPILWCGPTFLGGSPDLGHVVVESDVALTSTPLPAKDPHGLYEWSAGLPAAQQLQLISLLPPASPGGEEEQAPEASLGNRGSAIDARGAVSGDGSRVFFSTATHLYMRDTVAQKTLQLDAVQGGSVTIPSNNQVVFQFASGDGSRVFFSDEQALKADSGAAGGEPDLYECMIVEGSGGAPECDLIDLTPMKGSERGHVLPTIVGASTDGSYVYFVADGVLAPAASPGNCRGGGNPAYRCNLYVRYNGVTTFIASLSDLDRPDWADGSPALSGLTARVSPGGGWLAFMSRRSLTGYDNRDAASGVPDEEVFLYEAAHGRLTCASCDPSGARPRGVEYGSDNLALSNGAHPWENSDWLAANIPGWTRYRLDTAVHQPRYLSDSGRLFFNSTDNLVAKDSNGVGDVYEFEPEGVPATEHACSLSSTNGGVAYRPARSFEVVGEPRGEEAAGCVGLISSGTSKEESALLDASESGGDVFFLSTAILSPLDVEGSRTVYDAHECTAASPCPAPVAASPPACTTEASCKAPPSLQPAIFGLPASATFSGPGNLTPPPPPATAKGKTAGQVRAARLASALKTCHRDKRRAKRRACEKAAQRRYGASASRIVKRAGNERRAGR